MLSDLNLLYNTVDALKCLAVDLYNEGKFVEARRRTIEALRDAVDIEQRVRLYGNWGMIERAMGNLEEAQFIHEVCAPLLQGASHTARGHHHNGLALTYRRMGKIDLALAEYRKAQEQYEESDEYQYVASVHNNIAYLLLLIDKAGEALKHLLVARSIYERFGETVHVAQVDDTIAQAYVSLEDYDQAFNYSSKSVSVLFLLLPEERLAFDASWRTLEKIVDVRRSSPMEGLRQKGSTV